MPAVKKFDTNKIRSAFISDQQTLRQLSEQFGCSYSYLASMSSRERWYPQRRALQQQAEQAASDALVERVAARSSELAKLKALTAVGACREIAKGGRATARVIATGFSGVGGARCEAVEDGD